MNALQERALREMLRRNIVGRVRPRQPYQLIILKEDGKESVQVEEVYEFSLIESMIKPHLERGESVFISSTRKNLG